MDNNSSIMGISRFCC